MSTRMVLGLVGLVCSLVVMLQGADYPAKPVRIIEPFGAGGGPDVISRAVSPKLSALWGQPVTVENHPGAGSTAAPALVAKSPSDGYTLLVNTSALAYSAAVLKNLPYNPLKDFIPVAPLTIVIRCIGDQIQRQPIIRVGEIRAPLCKAELHLVSVCLVVVCIEFYR